MSLVWKLMIGILSLIAPVAWAESGGGLLLEDLLEARISSPSKHPQRPAEAPSMVSVIGADEIRHFGWRTLAEALDSLRGVHITRDRNTTYLGLRGFGRPGDYNNRILMLIDGVRVNDGVYDQAPVGQDFPLDLALVERIEYVPGAGSVMYGGNAVFGVINVITSAGARRGTELEAGAASGRGFSLRASHGGRDEAGNDLLLSVSRTRGRGADLYFESYDQPGAEPWSRGLDHESVDSVFARYARGAFDASLIASKRHKGVPGGPWAIDLNDPFNRERESRVLGSLRYEQRLDPTRTLSLQAYASNYSYAGHWISAGVPEPADRAESHSLGGEVRLVTTALRGQTLVAGASWRDDRTRWQSNLSMDENAPRRAFGLFMQDDWIIGPRLMLSAGLRHDMVRDRVSTAYTSPRLALIAQPRPATTLKLIAGRAFRPPNAFETDYVYAGTNQANRDLQAESVYSSELGIEHAVSDVTRLAASMYRNRISNLVVLETDAVSGLQQHHNVGSAIARGLEMEMRSTVNGPWGESVLRGSVAWQRTRHESGAPIANAPSALAKFMLSMPLPRMMRLGWETHYLGARTTDSGSVGASGERVGGHALSHAALSGRLSDGLHWQLRLANIFDRRHDAVVGTEFSANFPGAQVAPMAVMPQDGRRIHGSLRWSF